MDGDLTGDIIRGVLSADGALKNQVLSLLRTGVLPTPSQVECEPYLTLKEVSLALHFHPSTLWRWGVPGHSLGGRRRFKLREVQDYLESDAFKNRVRASNRDRRLARQTGTTNPKEF